MNLNVIMAPSFTFLLLFFFHWMSDCIIPSFYFYIYFRNLFLSPFHVH